LRFFAIALLIAAVAFAVSPRDIIVNEIMYDSPESGADNEWIELLNMTGSPITLDSMWTLTDGEGTYRFECITIDAGGYLIIKVNENPSTPFPFEPDVDASGRGIILNNTSDEAIILYDGMVVDSVTYFSSWGARGDGSTLERVSPLGPSNSPENWLPSEVEGGTPWLENSVYDTSIDFPPVVGGLFHTPEFPTPTDDVVVTARIVDDGEITKALLFYAIDFGEPDSTALSPTSPGAIIWNGTIPANPAGATVRYHAVVEDDAGQTDTTQISAFFVTSGDTIDGDIVINEIMYDPATPRSDNYFEYIEFYNRGTASVYMSGWFIKDDLEYNTFQIPLGGVVVAPGEFLVVAKNADSIETAYGITGVIGGVPFNLNNTGDAVRLYNADGDLVDFVYYTNRAPWPTEPNNGGPSLELIDPSMDNALPESWGISEGQGSPGAPNTATVIAERSARPESVELLRIAPNPFNSTARIEAIVPSDCEARIAVFSIDGRFVGEVFSGELSAGLHEFPLAMTDSASGMFLVRMEFGGEFVVRKALLVK